MIYQLDFVGSGVRTIFGVGRFGTEIVDGQEVKHGPHEVNEDLAHQYETEEMQQLGWRVTKVESSELATVQSSELATVESSELATVESSELATVQSSELPSSELAN